ncbi:MAG: iron permease [Planctomycetota bacterium]|nr:MAG: iron permease [Planctomycetota bacterium]
MLGARHSSTTRPDLADFRGAPLTETSFVSPNFLLALYCLIIVAGSLAGGALPSWIRLTHLRLQLAMSFVSGLMLGIAFLHFLPHSAEYLPSPVSVAAWMLVGLLLMFFLLRLFHVHHYEDPDSPEPIHPAHEPGDHDHAGHAHHSHGHPHAGAHGHGHDYGGEVAVTHHRLSWVGTFFGLALHTLLDGVVLAAAVQAAAHEAGSLALLAFGVFLAVLLHKPLDALSITALMRAGGWPEASRRLVNFAFALMCPLGASLFSFGIAASSSTYTDTIIGAALAFSGGFFICIALGDLLPEVQFHAHDRGKLSAALLLGVVLAAAIESTHSHDHDHHHGGHGQHEAHDDHDDQGEAGDDGDDGGHNDHHDHGHEDHDNHEEHDH